MIWFTAIFVFVGFIFPVIDYFWDKKIKGNLQNHNKIKTYSLIMLYQWLIVGCIFLGFYMMNIPFQELRFVATFEDLSSFTGFLCGVLVSVFFFLAIFLIFPLGRKRIISMFEAIEMLLPNGWKERLMFAGVALTAGFCEEVIYRGFMFYYLNQLGWNLSAVTIAIITSVLFGLAHFYQGWKNVILTGFIGFAMARLFMLCDSIWIPIILHIVIDLRFAVMPNLKKLFIKLKPAA